MNLRDVAQRLWESRIIGLGLAVLAVVVALLFTFRISFSPLSLSPRALQMGVAQTSVLVDSRRSSLGSASGDARGLASITSDITQIADSSAVTVPVARALHVAPANIGVQVQVTQQIPLSQSQPLEPQVGTEILATRRHYYLVAHNTSGSQVIQLFSQAPSGHDAVLMVQVAAQALRRFIAAQVAAGHVASGDAVVIKPLGNLYGQTLDSHVSEEAAVLIAVVAWILAMTAVLTIKGQSRRAANRPPRAQPVQG